MSPIGANWGVVDPDLKVKGVKGVSVIDLSVLVRIPLQTVWGTPELMTYLAIYSYCAYAGASISYWRERF